MITGKNPYSDLPSKAFWKQAVASKSMFDITDLWQPKFDINKNHKVSTFGSCFAQHIGRSLKSRGFNWFITEKGPEHCSPDLLKAYNYGIFTARTGNIYTTSLLKQWCEWALGKRSVPEEYWLKDGRYIDPFRPRIETEGFLSLDEMRRSQQETINCFRKSIVESNILVFTMGLTESWLNKLQGFEYPMCPGTVGGQFSESSHGFYNQDFAKVRENLLKSLELMKEVNPNLNVILTVSPVPLTATNSGKHVAVATMASKSILRAVAEDVSSANEFVDYFPSYEIINSPIFKGCFFEPNQRNVNPYGVNFVMDNFFKSIQTGAKSEVEVVPPSEENWFIENDEHCEEAVLASFGGNNE